MNTTTATVLTDLDSIKGGAGTDTLVIGDSTNAALSFPTSMTLDSIETITMSHLSDGAADNIAADVQNYADVDTISIVNAGTDINTVTVDTKANVQTLTISGGAGADITAIAITDNGTAASATAATTDVLSSITLIGATGTGTVSTDALTFASVKNVAGLVTNTDGYVNAADLRTLTVQHNGGTNGGVKDTGATTVNWNVDAATTNSGTNTYALQRR